MRKIKFLGLTGSMDGVRSGEVIEMLPKKTQYCSYCHPFWGRFQPGEKRCQDARKNILFIPYRHLSAHPCNFPAPSIRAYLLSLAHKQEQVKRMILIQDTKREAGRRQHAKEGILGDGSGLYYLDVFPLTRPANAGGSLPRMGAGFFCSLKSLV